VSDRATWLLDGQAIGTGARLLSTQITTQGAHTVTLTFANSAGVVGSASIKVNVGPPTGKPSVTITQPTLPPEFVDRYVIPGVPFTLAATADAQGVATIAPSGYKWTSNLAGALGTGPSIQATLAEGTHQVTATVTDSLGRVGTDTVKIISQPPIG
jgi:PKD repeat protein